MFSNLAIAQSGNMGLFRGIVIKNPDFVLLMNFLCVFQIIYFTVQSFAIFLMATKYLKNGFTAS